VTGIGLALLLGIAAWVLIQRLRAFHGPFSPVPLTGDPGLALHPSFSPDGSQIVYSWNSRKQDNFDLYVKVIGSGDPLRFITDRAADFSPACYSQVDQKTSNIMLIDKFR
jgi:Tol biopolymer transport system component